MALDDDRDNNSFIREIVESTEVKPKNTTMKVHRVSWLVDGKRKEKFFMARQWAEKYVTLLLDAADLIQTSIDPMIGDVEVDGDR